MVLEVIKIEYILEKDKSVSVINQSFFKDDLKLFAKIGSQIDSLMQNVNIYCKDVSMWIVIANFVVLTMNREKKTL